MYLSTQPCWCHPPECVEYFLTVSAYGGSVSIVPLLAYRSSHHDSVMQLSEYEIAVFLEQVGWRKRHIMLVLHTRWRCVQCYWGSGRSSLLWAISVLSSHTYFPAYQNITRISNTGSLVCNPRCPEVSWSWFCYQYQVHTRPLRTPRVQPLCKRPSSG
jgi:hypothetical protein